MINLSDHIHEFIAVIIFAAAVTFLVFFTKQGYTSSRTVDNVMRERTNVVENTGLTGTSYTMSGSQVYYEIIDSIKNNPDLTIMIQKEKNASSVLITQENRKLIIEEQEEGSRKIISLINIGNTYTKAFKVSDKGELTGVEYKPV